MRENPRCNLSKTSIYSLCLYILTLFVFVYDSRLIIISEIVLLIFVLSTALNILARQRFVYSKAYVVLGSLLLLSIFSIIWAVERSIAISSTLTLIQLFILFFCVYNSIRDEQDVELCLRYVVIGGIAMCIYAFYFYGINSVAQSFLTGFRLGGEISQANTFGYFSSLTFIIMIYYAVFYKKWWYYIISLIPLIFVIASGSRRSILIVALGVISIILINNVMKKKKIRTIVYFLILILLLPILLEAIQNISIFSRFSYLINFFVGEGIVDRSLIERREMINFGWALFKEKPILGFGSNQYRALYNMYFGVYKPAHNGYIQMLVNYGMIGFGLYYGMYIYIVKQLWRNVKDKMLPMGGIFLTIILVSLLGDLATDSLYNKFTYIILGLCFGFIRVTKKRAGIRTKNDYSFRCTNQAYE